MQNMWFVLPGLEYEGGELQGNPHHITATPIGD